MSDETRVYQRDATWSASSRRAGWGTTWHRVSASIPGVAACNRYLALLMEPAADPVDVLALCHRCFPSHPRPTEPELGDE